VTPEERGRADAQRYLAEPAALESLALARFGDGGPSEAALRRLLHGARVAPALLGLLPARVRERYAYWHGARRVLPGETWRRLVRGPVVLMYHAFGEPASRFVCPGPQLARQLGWLERRRRPVLALDELVAHRRAHTLPPAGAVVLTIDDGYADTSLVAAPLLRRHGAAATVFVVSGLVGSTGHGEGAPDLAGRPMLSAEQLRRLPGDGVAVGAHTRSHPVLPQLDAPELDSEVAGGRDDLEALMGAAPEAFAYPHGRTSEPVVDAVARAGFSVACGIERGLNDPATPLLELRRAPVDGDDSLLRFALAVWSGDPDLLRRPLWWLRGRLGRGR
jgi:peptidoglycan/xylan/chitin deacetylase (PgdA/CDA1 family)